MNYGYDFDFIINILDNFGLSDLFSFFLPIVLFFISFSLFYIILRKYIFIDVNYIKDKKSDFNFNKDKKSDFNFNKDFFKKFKRKFSKEDFYD